MFSTRRRNCSNLKASEVLGWVEGLLFEVAFDVVGEDVLPVEDLG